MTQRVDLALTLTALSAEAGRAIRLGRLAAGSSRSVTAVEGAAVAILALGQGTGAGALVTDRQHRARVAIGTGEAVLDGGRLALAVGRIAGRRHAGRAVAGWTLHDRRGVGLAGRRIRRLVAVEHSVARIAVVEVFALGTRRAQAAIALNGACAGLALLAGTGREVDVAGRRVGDDRWLAFAVGRVARDRRAGVIAGRAGDRGGRIQQAFAALLLAVEGAVAAVAIFELGAVGVRLAVAQGRAGGAAPPWQVSSPVHQVPSDSQSVPSFVGVSRHLPLAG